MKFVFLIIVMVIVVAAIVVFVRSRIAPTHQVYLKDIPRVLAELTAAKSTPAFAVFMFAKPGSSSKDDALNLQFSLEGGKAGFDWVLIAPANVEDQLRFTEFARANGYTLKLEEMNRVKYLRVENGDLAMLCREVISKMYGLIETDPMDMIVEGFEWKP
jgi:hypothetical protein